MAAHSRLRLTAEEYLALERAAETRSDYLDGMVIAETGSSRPHNLINLNIASELHRQLRDRPCEVYVNDMRILVSATGLYTYPDVAVVCGNPILTDTHFDTLTNPSLLIEVLSPTTAAYDRGTKLDHYRKLESVHEILVVSQESPSVIQYVRQKDRGIWMLTEITDLQATIALPSVGCGLAMAEIYRRVHFQDERK